MYTIGAALNKLGINFGKMSESEKYPREVAVMNKERHDAFIEKCKGLFISKSAAINALVELWVKGQVKIKAPGGDGVYPNEKSS